MDSLRKRKSWTRSWRVAMGEFNVLPISIKKQTLRELNKNLLLVYTGIKRNAHDIASGYINDLQKYIDVAENIISQKSSVRQISINIIILEAIRYTEIIKPDKNLYYYANQIINS